MKFIKKRNLFLVVLLILFSFEIFALPKSILADKYLLKAKKLRENKDYGGSVDYFKKIIDLNIKLPSDFYYHYGATIVLFKKDNPGSDKVSYEDAQKAFEKYLTKTGKRGKYYVKTLESLNKVEELQKIIKLGGCANGMCYIPAGKGLSAFKIDQYEVTVAEFKKCVDAGSCKKKNFDSGGSYDNYGKSGRENHPMNDVNWYGAKEYCEWAGKRLPTEAEWKYAAYGTDGRKYPWGNEEASCYYAVMDDGDKHGGSDSDGCGKNRTWPVGSKEAGKSPFGLYDMGGNVWEWVEDCYDSTCASRVLRGGGWNDESFVLRSSYRGSFKPASLSSRYGFRCVKSQ